MPVPNRPHKYRAKPTIVDGIKFASAKEARRYGVLKQLEKAGKIDELRLQVRYPIVIETVYVADFVYIDNHTGKYVVEDVKGYKTREYLRKKKLMRKQHGVDIVES